ncbi:hypothetical protein HK102_009056 [Quaeritorhiza haematococci]|nr:hypothetical protein HK102_009056 [Quaeritorhiza haematococci]
MKPATNLKKRRSRRSKPSWTKKQGQPPLPPKIEDVAQLFNTAITQFQPLESRCMKVKSILMRCSDAVQSLQQEKQELTLLPSACEMEVLKSSGGDDYVSRPSKRQAQHTPGTDKNG